MTIENFAALVYREVFGVMPVGGGYVAYTQKTKRVRRGGSVPEEHRRHYKVLFVGVES
jgi:hypothetical protein